MIEVFPGYFASPEGEIIPARRQGSSGRPLKQKTDKKGYKRVELHIGGKQKTFLVHRLIATAFIENPEKKRTVNHIDGNTSNNRVSNLEWATHSEQMCHASRTLLRDYSSRNVIVTDKMRRQSAINCRKTGLNNRKLNPEQEAEVLSLSAEGYSHQKISELMDGLVSRRTIGRVIEESSRSKP